MIDTLLKNESRFTPQAVWEAAQLEKGNYAVMTMHRPANVDEEHKLKEFMDAILENVNGAYSGSFSGPSTYCESP